MSELATVLEAVVMVPRLAMPDGSGGGEFEVSGGVDVPVPPPPDDVRNRRQAC